MRNRIPLLMALWLVWSATSALGTTWYVARDGSGDFTVIQDAVDEAAPGDVIQIGPGRYPEYQTVTSTPGQYWDGYVIITTDDLTFIGAGMELTVVGPEDPGENQYPAYGFRTLEPAALSLFNLRLENLSDVGVSFIIDRLTMDSCAVHNCDNAVLGMMPGGGVISNCRFTDSFTTAVSIHPPTQALEIRNCVFSNAEEGFSFNFGSLDCDVIDCTFDGGVVGGGFYDGSSGSVRNCHFTGFQNYGFGMAGSGAILFENNTIELDQGWGIGFLGCQSFTGSGNIIYSNANCLYVASYVEMDFHNNHILRGPAGYFAKTDTYWPYPEQHVDLSDNYWGTTDLEEIATWIFDANDSDLVNLYLDYEPIAEQPIASEQKTWGAVKELYR